MSDLPERIHVQWDQWEGSLVAKTDPGELKKAPYEDYIRADLAIGDNRMLVVKEKDTRARELLEQLYQWVVRKQYGHLGYVPEHQEELREKITIMIYTDICDLLMED